jgi:hypothetical protein
MSDNGSAMRVLGLFGRVLTVLALIVVIGMGLWVFNTITPDHEYVDVPVLRQGVGQALTFAALGILALSGMAILLRYLAAALRRIRLDKNDIYFIAALFLSFVTFLIGHYWK